MAESMYNELLIELECPICTNYMAPPIRQCITGHNICEPCRKSLKKCALCQGGFTEARNLSLEALATKMMYPCANKDLGCDAKLNHKDRESHVLSCRFKPVSCQMESCKWKGCMQDILEHWASKKTCSKPFQEYNVCQTKMKEECFYVNIVNCFDQLFWFKCKVTIDKVFWAVQFLGDVLQAEKFFYEIEVSKPDRRRKKLLLSDYCQAIDIANKYLLRDGMCISISKETATEFANIDQALTYTFRIRSVECVKTQDNRETAEVEDVQNSKRRDSPVSSAHQYKQDREHKPKLTYRRHR